MGIWDTHFHIEYAGGIHNSVDYVSDNLDTHFYIEYAVGIHNYICRENTGRTQICLDNMQVHGKHNFTENMQVGYTILWIISVGI